MFVAIEQNVLYTQLHGTADTDETLHSYSIQHVVRVYMQENNSGMNYFKGDNNSTGRDILL